MHLWRLGRIFMLTNISTGLPVGVAKGEGRLNGGNETRSLADGRL